MAGTATGSLGSIEHLAGENSGLDSFQQVPRPTSDPSRGARDRLLGVYLRQLCGCNEPIFKCTHLSSLPLTRLGAPLFLPLRHAKSLNPSDLWCTASGRSLRIPVCHISSILYPICILISIKSLSGLVLLQVIIYFKVYVRDPIHTKSLVCLS